jgi:hypothetical protein
MDVESVVVVLVVLVSTLVATLLTLLSVAQTPLRRSKRVDRPQQ